MMGVICNLLLGFIEAKSDKETVEKIKKEAGLEGRSFKSELNYPEEEWQSLLNAASKVLGVPKDTAEKMFAEYIIDVLIDQFGSFFRSSKGPIDLLRKVPKIHMDLPSAMQVTIIEKIKLLVDEESRIIYHYNSPNQLCIFLKSLAEQVFKHYGHEEYSIVENQCMKEGAEYCEIVMATKY